METEVAAEEAAGADDPAGTEAAKAAATATGEVSGDRTDDPEAAGAQGATRPLIPPPLTQRQALKSPSPAST